MMASPLHDVFDYGGDSIQKCLKKVLGVIPQMGLKTYPLYIQTPFTSCRMFLKISPEFARLQFDKAFANGIFHKFLNIL
jgi:hypothetical protein